ncbi:hypothetical protein HPP92_013901 [Vanilla planifolia]|uniref:Uncharacterized protein n=1 Tax=Vanilla planifolia TaxID=51239 RepID=A0A835UYW8_VANPL|nr:hypothetical protein HPP92_014307 [Vanilla planifolia]KAG0479182.1 hypothetical protein HPP92_013901 [Vanilla planifolia]
MRPSFLLHHVLLSFSYLVHIHSSSDVLPGCPDSCGDVRIPFPFGTEEGCYLPGFLITCNSTFSPPQPFLNKGNIPVTNISLDGTVIIQTLTSHDCYAPLALTPNIWRTWIDLTSLPYAFSNTRNKFTALGCDTVAINYRLNLNSNSANSFYYTSGCVSFCNELSSVINGSCSGIGCCQTLIPGGMKRIDTQLRSLNNHSSTWSFSPCSYAFLIDQEQYQFQISDLADFYKRKRVPTVLDWALGDGKTCENASQSSGYACGINADCINSTNLPGYRCICQSGFSGNPYLGDGCQDIDECADEATSPCSSICENEPGSYTCSCPGGYTGDGLKSGSGCNKKPTKFPLVHVVVGSGLGLLFLLLGGFGVYWVFQKRKMMKLKEKFFKQNGGLLLQQQLASHEGRMEETARIFTSEELKRATDNYSDARILGHGGNGTVYKGILHETGHVVAIKKSHLVEAVQIEQFVNEVVLLSKVIHKNVVRIVGCCLETAVPLLVYEYVPNGTLHYHLHVRRGSLSWESRLRIASETSGALAYLHSAIARPIFHRDVKAANILLDDNYMAKVSDFGASRLIPLDQAQVTTLVQGTLGYLDPEYFQSGQLTEKSDVYSFGVVLAEMLTGQKPLSTQRPLVEMNLAICFLLKMKEGKLDEIIEQRVKNEARKEQVEAIAEVAKRCLRLKGEERPTMREVAAEIDRTRRSDAIACQAAVAAAATVDSEHIIHTGESGRIEGMETRFFSSRITEGEFTDIGLTTYLTASATGDASLDQHLMISLQMQR